MLTKPGGFSIIISAKAQKKTVHSQTPEGVKKAGLRNAGCNAGGTGAGGQKQNSGE